MQAGGQVSAVAIAAEAVAVGGAAYAASSQKSSANQAAGAAKQSAAAESANQALTTSAANSYLSPWVSTGNAANTTLAGLLGLQTADTLQKPDITQFQQVSYGTGQGGQPSMTTNYVAYKNAMDQYNRNQLILQQQGASGQSGSLLAPYSADQYKNDPGYTPMVSSLADLQATPGYQWQLEQGNQGVNNSAAAKGGLLSSGTLKSLSRFNQGLASTSYQDAWNRSQQAYASAFGRNQTNKNTTASLLSGVSGAGQNAASTLAGIGTQMSGQANQTLQNNSAAQQTAAYSQGQAGANLATGINSAVQGGLANYQYGQSTNAINGLNNTLGSYLTNKSSNPGIY
jgi:hypothetical protein